MSPSVNASLQTGVAALIACALLFWLGVGAAFVFLLAGVWIEKYSAALHKQEVEAAIKETQELCARVERELGP